MSTAPVVGLLDTVTFPELMTVLVVGLVVLGPEKLPGIARQAGRWLNKLRTMTENLQEEVRGTLDDSEMESLKELGEFAIRPRAKLAEYARKAALEDGDDDDPTDGDAPAAEAPTLPAIGVGDDNPMKTHAPAPVEPAPETSGAPDSPAVDAATPARAEPVPAPSPVSSPSAAVPSPSAPVRNGSVPAHLAGTKLATGAMPPPEGGDGDAASEPSNDQS